MNTSINTYFPSMEIHRGNIIWSRSDLNSALPWLKIEEEIWNSAQDFLSRYCTLYSGSIKMHAFEMSFSHSRWLPSEIKMFFREIPTKEDFRDLLFNRVFPHLVAEIHAGKSLSLDYTATGFYCKHESLV